MFGKKENEYENFKTTSGLENRSASQEKSSPCFEDVVLEDINDLGQAHQYIDPIDSPHPYLLRTPKGLSVIDGHDLIEEAKQRGDKTIRAHVESTDQGDDVAKCLYNLRSRTKPRGGNARYPEILRRIKNCLFRLNDNDKSLVRLRHGGNRKTKQFQEDKSHNIGAILQRFTGYGKSSINHALSYAEFINDETLDQLAQGIPPAQHENEQRVGVGASKAFFRNIQKAKRELIKTLQKRSLNDDEIEKTISDRVWLAFTRNEKGKDVTVFNDDSLREPSIDDSVSQEPELGSLDNAQPSRYDYFSIINETADRLKKLEQENTSPENLIHTLNVAIRHLNALVTSLTSEQKAA